MERHGKPAAQRALGLNSTASSVKTQLLVGKRQWGRRKRDGNDVNLASLDPWGMLVAHV